MKLSHILAFAGGIVAGVAAGILLAPDSGANTRQKIADNLKEKGLYINKESFDAFVAKVKGKLKGAFSDEELDQAVDEVLAEEKK